MKQALTLAFLLFAQGAIAVTLTITFEDTKGKDAEVFYAVFADSEEFPKGGTFDEGSVKNHPDQKSVTVSLELPPGEYAISAFLDENGNKKLDTNFLGIPKERFGFSQNPTILAGPPSFEKASVKLERDTAIVIKLITLLDQ